MNRESRKCVQLCLFTALVMLGMFAGHIDAQTVPGGGLRLVGTIDGGKLAGAVFQDSTGKQIFVPVQETMPDGSRIIKIRDDSILLKGEDGNLYDMFIARDTKTVSTNPQPSQPPAISQPAAAEVSPANPPVRKRNRRGPPEEE